MSDSIRRLLNVEARILSEKEGLVEYIASDSTLDSYLESILATGWQFTHFAKNSPFVDSHNYWTIEALLGKVESARLEGGQLVERVRWAIDVTESKLVQIGWKMTLGGFLKAVSVGFRSVQSVWPGDSGWDGFVKQANLGPDDAAKCRRIFVKQEQLELSACILGANPSAVAKAYHERCISDADLAAVGFNDEDLQFLTVAGKAADRPDLDDVTRLMIGREMKRISAKQPHLRNNAPSNPSPSPGKPDGGEMARRQAEERAGFLRKLDALVSKR